MTFSFHLACCKYLYFVDMWLQAAHNLGLMQPLTREQSAEIGNVTYWDKSSGHTNDPMVTHADTLTQEVKSICTKDKLCREFKCHIAAAHIQYEKGEVLPVDLTLLARVGGFLPDSPFENPEKLYS